MIQIRDHSVPRLCRKRGLLSLLLIISDLKQAMSWKAQWLSREPIQNIHPRRSGHVAFHAGSSPYVFGGYVEEDAPENSEISYNRYVKNDLWRWEDNRWQKIETEGDIPQSRLVSTATFLDNKCYLMGGWDPQTQGTGGVILDTVHCWDVSTRRWSCLEATMPDGPTSRHVAVALSDQILVHTHRCHNYVLLFDPKTESFRKQATTGSCPSSRGLHAATRLNRNQVLFFGGAAQSGDMSDETFLLDTNTWQWTALNAQGPTARAAPCLVRVDDETALLFGGAEATSTGLKPRGDVWLLDINKTNRWELLIDDQDNTGQKRPPPRNAATLSLAEEESDTKTFLLTGGWHPFVKTYDDCFMLKLVKS